jgi:cation/acetate symporter
MVSLAFAIAASANFPAIVLSIFWPGATSAGLVASMAIGAASTLVLIWLSPTVQVDLLHRADALFPLKNPALVTIPLSFLAGIVVSLLTAGSGQEERFKHAARLARMHRGVGSSP